MFRINSLLACFFNVTKAGSTLHAEVVGGVTTFAAMAYIIVVNPAILQAAGLPPGPSTIATVLVAVFGCLLMGLYANRPFAVAPYMGENAFIAFGLTAMGIGWQLRIGAVFISGLIFLLLTLVKLRTWLVTAISPSMKYSFAAGIGLFLAFIGLYECGIVTSFDEGLPVPSSTALTKSAVPVKLGNLNDPKVLLAVGGFLITAVLIARGIRGAILIGMFVTAALGYFAGELTLPKTVFSLPFTGEHVLAPIAFQLDISGTLNVRFIPVLLTLFLLGFLDTLGTLVGVGAVGGMLDEKGNLPQVERPMLVDAASCVFSAVIGSSTSGAFIESAAGVREGARTGLAAVVTGVLFALSLFFLPLFAPLQGAKFVYGPALIAVGVLMLDSIRRIDFDDLTELIPAFVTIALIVFTYNIGNGLTAGLLIYPVLKILCGRWKEVTASSVVLAALCLAYYLWGLPH